MGEFIEDKRHGWGLHVLKFGDRYKGQFEKDQMQGRGIYTFSKTSPQNGAAAGPGVQYFLGDLKENAFHGLGRMAFRDGTHYFGSFNNNCLQSERAIIKYANGDTYKGGVQQNMKSDPKEGKYIYANGDTYEGQFRGDRKDGEGKLLIAAQHITY